MTRLADTVGTATPVIGLIHLPPWPGTALDADARAMAGSVERAKREHTLSNFRGSLPFFGRSTRFFAR